MALPEEARIVPLAKTPPDNIRVRLTRVWPLLRREGEQIDISKYAETAGVIRETARMDIDLAVSVGIFEERGGGIYLSEGGDEILQTIERTPDRHPSESLLLALESGQFEGVFRARDIFIFLGKDKSNVARRDIPWGLERGIIERVGMSNRGHYKFLEGAGERLLAQTPRDGNSAGRLMFLALCVLTACDSCGHYLG